MHLSLSTLFMPFFAFGALNRSFFPTLFSKTHEGLGLVLYRKRRISNPMERKRQKVGVKQPIQESVFQPYGTKTEESRYFEKYYSDPMHSFSDRVGKNGLGKWLLTIPFRKTLQ